MIVNRIGYLNYNQVIDLINSGELFYIYKTHKGTEILIKGVSKYFIYFCTTSDSFTIYYPIFDKLPYKTIQGRKIVQCVKCIFNSKTDSIKQLDSTNWNNGNQIMSYESFD